MLEQDARRAALAPSDRMASLLAPPEAEGGYEFILAEPLPDGTASWDRDEELRIHRRLFAAEENLLPPDSIPAGLAGTSLRGRFTRESAWTTSPAADPAHPFTGPLDPSRWRVTAASFTADVELDTQGPNDYRLPGQDVFVVVEDLSKPIGAPGRFLLGRWVNLDGAWTSIKSAWR
jgi:hypothetical protein